MKQEDKNLLFPDISARLPYHVRVKVWLKYGTTEEGVLDLEHNYGDVLRGAFYYKEIVDIKPYLRPMSSMTKEEIQELSKIDGKRLILSARHLTFHVDGEVIDYLNRKMFDYRGLIKKGIALEAPEGMYN